MIKLSKDEKLKPTEQTEIEKPVVGEARFRSFYASLAAAALAETQRFEKRRHWSKV